MRIHERFTRKVQIISTQAQAYGRAISILDWETKEEITGVKSFTIHGDVNEVTWVRLIYYEQNESEHIVTDDNGDPMLKTIELPNPEIDLAAYAVEEEHDADS